MRIVVYGVGAIGGTLLAELARAGVEVLGIARGRMLEAIRKDGLTLHTPHETYTQPVECVSAPAEIRFRPDDAVFLTMQTQDAGAALAELRAAGVTDQPVFCFQNGIENERAALRLFANVYAVTVMMPSNYLEPGRIVVNAAPRYGLFEIGRYPFGHDAVVTGVCALLETANFKTIATDRPMTAKHGKLVMNLGNLMSAVLRPGQDPSAPVEMARAEAAAVLSAAGLDWREVGASDPRRKAHVQITPVPGHERIGSSTAQSIRRGTGSVETDYLNGEICLLGRLHGVPTPVNARLMALAQDLLSGRIAAASLTAPELARMLTP